MSIVLEKIRQIAADIFQVPTNDIAADSSPKTIASWDSIQQLNLVLAIEQEFGIQFQPEELDKIHSIGDVVSLLEAKIPN